MTISTRIGFKAITLLSLVLFLSIALHAQNFILKGAVKDSATQKPLEGVEVKILNAKTRPVLTDAAGEFSISCVNGDDLSVLGVGYKRYTTRIESAGFVTIYLSMSAAEQLQDVVVTATGIKKEAKRLGYAVQTVDASKLTQAREPDPLNALKGNAAGLIININQEMGHAPSVIMRGEGAPMYVVDGVPMTSDTYNINPDDIESFTILKGPNAAALYGFAGQNGAIIINTKKGSKNRRGFSIDVNSSTQFNKGFIALPKTQDEYGPGEYGTYAFGNGAGAGKNDYDYDGGWGPKLDGRLLPQYDGQYDPNQTYTTTFPNGSTPYVGHIKPTPWIARGKNNLQRFIQTGILSANSVAISSTSEKTDVRFSLGNTYQKGIIPNTSLNNFNFTGNVTQRFTSKLTLNTYFNYNRQSTPNISDVNYGPNSVIYNISLWGGADWNIADMRDYWQPGPGKVGIQQKYAEYWRYNNPYFMSYEWLRGHYMNNEYGYMTLSYKANDNWEFVVRPSLNAYDFFNTEKVPYSAHSYRAKALGDYREDKRSLFQTNVEVQARYHKNRIAGFLDVQGLVGANVRSFKFNSSLTSTNYLIVPEQYSFSNSLNPIAATGFNSSMKVLSAYSSLDVGYKSYVTLNITGRVDKSSSLPTNTYTYFYPSFNLATVVSEYVKLPEVISFLKLRTSYAKSKAGGTSPTFAFAPSTYTSPFAALLPLGFPGSEYGYVFPSPYDGPTYQFGSTYSLGSSYNNISSARYTDNLINKNINTSDVKSWEFGLDVRFLKNTIGLDVTRYHYNITDIVNQSISPASGYTSYVTNGNIHTNDGWEITLNATPIKNPNGFGWNVSANWFTFVKKWVDYSSPDNYMYNGTRTDLVYDDAFVRTPDGKMVIGQDGLLMRFSDLSSAKKIYGHSDPNWQWGLVNTLSYKNISLRFQFDGMVGGVMEDYVRKKALQGGRHIETVQGEFGKHRQDDEKTNKTYLGSYIGDGVNLSGAPIQLDPITGTITNYKSLTATQNNIPTSVQAYVSQMASIPDLDIIKKTYAKLREVTITYVLPQKFIGTHSFIKQASASLVGRNLLYFFPGRYKDIDVDQYTQGNNAGLQTPTTRSYGINVNISF